MRYLVQILSQKEQAFSDTFIKSTGVKVSQYKSTQLQLRIIAIGNKLFEKWTLTTNGEKSDYIIKYEVYVQV